MRKNLIHRFIHLRIFISMVFMKMMQTKTAINAFYAMRNNLIKPTSPFKSIQCSCISNYTISRVVQLRKIVHQQHFWKYFGVHILFATLAHTGGPRSKGTLPLLCNKTSMEKPACDDSPLICYKFKRVTGKPFSIDVMITLPFSKGTKSPASSLIYIY